MALPIHSKAQDHLPPKVLRFIVYNLYITCVQDRNLDVHFCSLNDPCCVAWSGLLPLFRARAVSSTWNEAILEISTLKEHLFFRRVEDAYYPHPWHINTKVRKGVLLNRYRVYRTISSETGTGVYKAYDFGHPAGCSKADRVIIKAWLSATDRECVVEQQVYEIIRTPPVSGTPVVHSSDYDKEHGVFALVLQRLGPSLEEVLELLPKNQRFDDRMILAVAIQMLDRYKDIHARGIIHNGIKPGNICLPPYDSGVETQLYAIDFGLSFLLDAAATEFLPSAHRADTVGNRSYLSALGHHGITQSQRDDLESLAYLLSSLRHGDLPWDPPKIWRLKMATPASVIFRGMDQSYFDFWKDVKGLAFGEAPDYDTMRKRFEDCWKQGGYGDVPGRVDWWEELALYVNSSL
ncbi:kinase-like domain-containing protein [Collybia nuda]|uniref:Kinase-like domain-containing protein n=1 Tax=Collybia nuda TaxID=64659 RepID=A0A9P5Y970_9AGAR|nr:kinase-like domain-containing protein [Collybia nuda]